jgi:hypothetical protein
MKIINKISLIISTGILLLMVSIFLIINTFYSSKAYASEDYKYLNDLSGTYIIKNYSSLSDDDYYCLSIEESYVSREDFDAPGINIHELKKPAPAYQRFEFILDEIENGMAIYSITSNIDNDGRLDVINGSFTERNGLHFYHKNNSDAQKWSVRTKDNGKTVQIFSSVHPEFFLANNGFGKCIITTTQKQANWELISTAGNIGLNSQTYILDDKTDYDISGKEPVSRFLSPLDDGSGIISDVVNFGVSGAGLEKKEYNNTLAISVPYTSKFAINTSFVYGSIDENVKWERNRKVGVANAGGKERDWAIDTDDWKMYDSSGNGEEVGLGMYIIEKSDDGINWKNYIIKSFVSENREQDIFEIDGNLIAKGVYLRISFLFEIYAHWTVSKNDNKYIWKNIREVSDPIFVCVDGFAEDGFGSVTVNDLDFDAPSIDEEESGFSIEQIKKAQTLTDESWTTKGFKINCAFPSYKIEIQKNDGYYITVSDGYEVKESGRYKIRVTSGLGLVKEITVYVYSSSELMEQYFGGIAFSNATNENGFVRGKRILSGNSTFLEENDIKLNYSFATVPVFEKGCKISYGKTSLFPKLKGIISYESEDGSESFNFNSYDYGYQKELNIPGHYFAEVSNESKSGRIISYSFEWWVVDKAPGPAINELLIKEKSQKTYDLIPTYYGVIVDGDKYTFIEEDNLVEKNQVMYYAFRDYNSALSFALRVEKEYTSKTSDGMFIYTRSNYGPNIKLDEFDLFDAMYKNAKDNVQKMYFSNASEESMKIFKIYDEEGNVKTYDDGVTETVAYCIEEGTNYCVVTTDKVELAKLTARQPYINNFEFISNPLDSTSVELIDENSNVYNINYDEKVEDQLKEANAPSGKYTVVEKTIYGDTNSYDVYYIEKGSKCDTILTISIDGNNVLFSSEDNDTIINDINSFTLINGENKNDFHSLVLIDDGNKKIPFDINEIKEDKNITFTEKGSYTIFVEDRFGNNYSFEINIE